MTMPVDNLVSNWAYMIMASLAWNLKAWYALSLPTKGRWHKKHKSQKRKVLRMEFKKFRNSFIMLPCQIIKTGRRLLYRLLGWNDYLDIFFRAVKSFRGPLRCWRVGIWCRDTDVPICVGFFDVLKVGEIMTKRKVGTFLGRYRLTGIGCAEKISPPGIQKTNRVRLFKD